MPCWRPNAAKAPMCARSPAISAGRWARSATFRRCGGAGSGRFGEADMIPLEQVEALCHRAAAGEGHLADTLLPIETALDDIPALAVSPADAARLQRGQAVLLRGRDASIFRGMVQVASGGQLVAIAEVERGEIVPRRVFNLTGIAGRAGRERGLMTMSITTARKAEVDQDVRRQSPATPVRPKCRLHCSRSGSTT